MGGLTEVLCVERKGLYLRCVSIPFQLCKRSNKLDLPASWRLITPRNAAVSLIPCGSLCLAHGAYSSGCSQVSFVEWEAKWNLCPWHHGHFVHEPVKQWQQRLKKSLIVLYQEHHLCTCVLKCSSAGVLLCFWSVCLYCDLICRGLAAYLTILRQISSHVPFQSLTCWSDHSVQPMNPNILCILPFFKLTVWPGVLPDVPAT